MRSHAWQKAFLLCFSIAFAVLLLSGAPRLIAASGEETDKADIRMRPEQAYLCSGSVMETNTSEAEQIESNRFAQRGDAVQLYAAAGAPEGCTANADANGNVLLRGNYMRSVYQVFALGDGFV